MAIRTLYPRETTWMSLTLTASLNEPEMKHIDLYGIYWVSALKLTEFNLALHMFSTTSQEA